MSETPCKRCNGTGHLPHFAHSDGGKCWACTDKVDTSYTASVAPKTDAEAKADWDALCAARSAARRARRVASGT